MRGKYRDVEMFGGEKYSTQKYLSPSSHSNVLTLNLVRHSRPSHFQTKNRGQSLTLPKTLLPN